MDEYPANGEPADDRPGAPHDRTEPDAAASESNASQSDASDAEPLEPLPPAQLAGAAPEPPAPSEPLAPPVWGASSSTWSASHEGAGNGGSQPYGTVGHDAAAPPPFGPPPGTAPGAGAGEPTIPSAAWAPVPPPGRSERRERPGLKAAFIGGIVGALVGAMAAGGIVAAVDDNGPTRTIIEQSSSNTQARPASVIQSPGDIRSILDKVEPAVVRINVTVNGGFSGTEEGVGTGFIISSDGYIVTNAHVAGDASTIQVQLQNGRVVPGKLVGASTQSDLAVVKIDGRNLPTVELGDSDSLEVGDQVVAIGNALGLEGEPTVTSGIVSGLNRVLQEPNNVDIANTIQTDAAINPGNSGGPLVDANGRVVGINTAIANPSESNNIGFAIAISPAKSVIDALRKGQEPQVAFLGVGTEPVTSDLVQRRNLEVDQGAYVSSVSSGSAAADAGIRAGDVIVKVDGDRVTSSEDVINAVRRHTPGDTISVTVNRSGTERTFEIKLRSRPTS
jgi:S1-C subfamily serine protease